ncbi:MAG: hypothetical protein LBD14_05450 [Puniceicoccales bacterium]|nr:hypothetical protein [Puniceicoccales bacterium]
MFHETFLADDYSPDSRVRDTCDGLAFAMRPHGGVFSFVFGGMGGIEKHTMCATTNPPVQAPPSA